MAPPKKTAKRPIPDPPREDEATRSERTIRATVRGGSHDGRGVSFSEAQWAVIEDALRRFNADVDAPDEFPSITRVERRNARYAHAKVVELLNCMRRGS